MSRWLPGLGACFLALSFVVLSPSPAIAAPSLDSFEKCLLDRVNEARAAAGRAPVQMATDLIPPVRDWSRWMRFNDFEHMSSATRNQILPANWTTWAENIAWHGNANLANCDAVHQMWMNSPGHRANILNSSMRFVVIGTYYDSSGWWATQLFFDASGYTPSCDLNCDDEIFFYRGDGLFRYYDVGADGSIGVPLNSGSKYTQGWSAITALDLNGDGRDEMFFYREDGEFRFYTVRSGGALDAPLNSGSNFSRGWTSITATDLDGDNTDEMFFYRSTDGAYRYYDMKPNGTLGTLLTGGTGYSLGWNSITAIDLDGDGHDEMFFYRSTDGAYRYYDMKPNGTLGTLLTGGTGYSLGWNSITAIDLDGDNTDEMFFYRSTDGAYRYYDMKPNGTLGTLLTGGTGYTTGWDAITAISLD